MKILDTKTVLEANLFTVNTIDIQYTNNEHATWYTVKMKYPSVFIVPVTEDNKIYLISQYRPMLDRTQLEIPAGFMDKDEQVIEAAKRELKEETGLSANKWHVFNPVELTSSTIQAKMYILLAQELSDGTSALEASEEISVVKIPIADVLEKIVQGEIVDGPAVTALLLVNEYLRKT